MRRLSIDQPVRIVRVGNDFVRRFAPALAFIACLAADPATEAQTSPACPTGLMHRDEAASGTLLLKTTTAGCYLGAPRVAADIAVDVSGPVARTKVTQRFENPADGWVEGVYVFPLPEGGAVDTLRMKIGKRFIEGEIKERQEARQIYEKAKMDGKKASLVEEDRPNVFTNQVANIGPRETIVVQIEYQESLPFDRDRYRLRIPLVVAPRYNPQPSVILAGYHEGSEQFTVSDPVPDRNRLDSPVLRPEFGKTNPVSITVHLQAGFPLGDVQSGSHAISVVRDGDSGATVALKDGETPADRDFTLSFAPRPGAAPTVSLLKQAKDGSDYLLALVVPPAMNKDFAPKPRETIFVLDNSGSMAGESIRQAKASLLLALGRLKPADRFNVIRFDNTLTVLFPRTVDASPANLAAAKSYVNGLDAAGGTEMLPALLAALNDDTPEDTTHLRQVIFLTDGEVGNEAELFSAIAHKLGRTRLFTVGIGSAPNTYFMSGAARAGRGTYTYIGSTDEVAPRMAELFAKLERPVMTDLTASWTKAQPESWPNPLPDLYDGEPVVLTARTAGLRGELILSGKFEGEPWRMTLDLAQAQNADDIEKLWARDKIAALEDSRVLGVDATLIDHAVLDVALAHHLTSRLTSLVAVDVTPSRPLDTPLSTQQVALNLPAGWDFDKVFGGDVPAAREEHAEIPAGLLNQLVMRPGDADAVQPEDAKLVLPQGGTDSRLLMIVGGALLALALMLMRGKRTGVP